VVTGSPAEIVALKSPGVEPRRSKAGWIGEAWSAVHDDEMTGHAGEQATKSNFLSRTALLADGEAWRGNPSGNIDIGQWEVVALAEQWRIHCFCQPVGKTISVVQRRAMPGRPT